jgi:SSS family solute:Na+ symporter
MFKEIQATKPGFLTLPKSGLGISWFISTVVMTVLGAVMWPHVFNATYSAKNAKAIRKNSIITPLYTLMLLFIFFVGFAAIGQVPGLTGPATDLALLKLSVKTFDPWFVGLIGAAGLLTALVPGSMLLMSASTSVAKNIYKVMVPAATDRQVSMLAKWLVPVLSLICVYFTLSGGQGIVTLLLMAYSFITQLLPALVFSFMKKNFVTKAGASVGMISGVIAVAYMTLTQATIATLFPSLPQGMKDLNSGIIALLINVVITVIVSLVTSKNANSNNVNTKTA